MVLHGNWLASPPQRLLLYLLALKQCFTIICVLGVCGCVDHRTISGSPSSLFTKWFPEIKFRLSSNKCPYPSGQPGILALKHLPSKHAPLVCSCKLESPTSVELPGCRHGLKHFSLWNLQNTCQPYSTNSVSPLP